MQQAFDSTVMGYGVCVFVGVPPNGVTFPLMPFNLLMGRTLKGTIFGDYKSKDHLPSLVNQYISGKLNFDKVITHKLSLEQINEGFELLRQGKSIRTVLTIAKE